MELLSSPRTRAWKEIHVENFKWNLDCLKELMPEGCECMAVVKADGYGHGAVISARALEKCGIKAFAVATLEEAIELRRHDISGLILILGYTQPVNAELLADYDLIQTAVDFEHARQLNHAFEKLGRTGRIHIKIDTGMSRLGESYENIKKIEKIFHMENLSVEGCYSHLCAADSDSMQDREYEDRQADHFFSTVLQIRADGYEVPKVHLLSSYGLLNYASYGGDYVRLGILLYGVFSNSDKERDRLPLRPVMEWKARIAQVKEIPAGASVSYGRTFEAADNMKIAVVTIGYADGLPRSLSGKGKVLIRGQFAPIIGKICMDQMVVDVSGISGVRAGDIVTVMGKQKDKEISASGIAEAAGTITNELLSRVGSRLPEVVCSGS